MNNSILHGIPDDEFIRGDAPMTKEEIRTISVSKLRLRQDSSVLDIGAGTGSVAIEMARILKNGRIYAVEKDKAAVGLIRRNVKKFNVHNVIIVQGTAPDVLLEVPKFDRAFIGGSAGYLVEILTWLDGHIAPAGRIVINAVTLETLYTSRQFFTWHNYLGLEIIQVAVSRLSDSGGAAILRSQNPVFIISAQKE